MIQRLLRVIVVLTCLIIMVPCLILTVITYPLFNFSLIEADLVIFSNALESDNWKFTEIFNALK